LTGRPLPEPKINFPEPDPHHYLSIDNFNPYRAGEITFLQTAAWLAKAATLIDVEKRILEKILYCEITHEIDKKSILFTWEQYFETIDHSEFQEDKAIIFAQKMIQFQPTLNSTEENYYFFMLFHPLEKKAKANPRYWAEILLKITITFLKITYPLDDTLKKCWQEYLAYEKGLAYYLLGYELEAYKLLRNATQYAIKAKNWTLGRNAAFIATFDLCKQHKSIKEFAQSNYELFLCIEGLGLSPEHIQNLGINMFRFWSTLRWQKIFSSDLRTIEYLNETAKLLKALNFNESEASPIMIALLLKNFNHPRNYETFTKFIRDIPQEIKSLLESKK
jgi:hypothetical protein